MADSVAQKVIKKTDELMYFRQNWEYLWEECIRYINPHRGDVLTHHTPGRNRTQHLYDATAPYANNQLAAALHSFLTSPVELWFSLRPTDYDLMEDEEVTEYLRYAEDVLYHRYFLEEETGFTQAIHEVYLDLGALGTSVLYTEDIAGSKFRFRALHLGECAIAENDRGDVDQLVRCYERTYAQLVDRFGVDNLPQQIKDMGDRNPNYMHKIIHMVAPQEKFDVESNMEFVSIFVSKEFSETLSQEGFNEFPYMVPRWSRTASELYGRGPGMQILAEIKMVNSMSKVNLRAAQKVVDPPMQAPNEGFLMPANINPGAMNYYESGTQDRIEAINLGARPDIGMETLASRQEMILRAFYADLLQLREGPEMTATEVLQRTEDRMRLMAPVVSRIQRELLSPVVYRTLLVAIRRGDIPTPPQQLQGKDMQISYTSPFVKAQQATKLFNYQRFMDSILGIVQIKPDAIDNLDADATIRWAHKVIEAPPDLLVDQRKVQQIRQQRQEQMEQEEAKMDMERAADIESKTQEPRPSNV